MRVIDIASMIGVFVGIYAVWYSVKTSKDYKLRIIDKKERRISLIDRELVNRYGLHRGVGGPMTSLDIERMRLEQEIDEIKRTL